MSSDLIPYKKAVKAKPNNASMIVIEFVSWDGAQIERVEHEFKTVGKQSIPVAPELPRQYRMAMHPEWEALAEKILEGVDTASFEELDLKYLDMNDLTDIVGITYFMPEYYNIGSHRPDWVDWLCDFEDSWCDLFKDIEDLADYAIPCLPPHTHHILLKEHIEKHNLDCLPIGNRVKPPSLKEALQMMMDKVNEFETREERREILLEMEHLQNKNPVVDDNEW